MKGQGSGIRDRIGTTARRGGCLALVLLGLLPALASAQARPGSLDPSFGDRGRVVRATDLRGPWWKAATDTVGLPGGTTVVLADRKLYAFGRDGSTRREFGGGVVAVTAPDGAEAVPVGLAVDPQGRLLVAGTAVTVASGNPEQTVEHALVSRYTATGQLDPSFGKGGTVVTDLGLPTRRVREGDPAARPQVQGSGVAVDAAGRVVLTGSRVTMIGPCRGSSGLVYREAFVARLDPSGSPDLSFGKAGVVRLDGIARIDPPVVDADGGVYVSTPAGAENPCSEPNYNRFIGHLAASGGADPGFGAGGWLRLPARGAENAEEAEPLTVLALDQRDRLLAYFDSKLRRYLPSGRLDPGFGTGGAVALPVRGGSAAIADVAADRRGGVLLAGAFLPGRQELADAPRNGAFLLARVTGRGKVDRGFGRAGLVTTRFGRGSRAVGSSLLLSGSGATLAGTLKSPRLNAGTGLALARYRLGGQ